MSTCGDPQCGGGCGYCTQHDTWGSRSEHSWWRHSAGPNVGHACWVGCGPIHRDDDPRPGDECARCGVECGPLWPADSECEA